MKYLIGNWKAKLNWTEAQAWLTSWQELVMTSPLPADKQVILAPPAVFYAAMAAKKPSLALALQDISQFAGGAYTGEVTITNLVDLLPAYTIIGHSERRAHFGETNQLILQKAQNLWSAGITPIICLDTDQAAAMAQLLSTVDAPYLIAYEPLSAIGTGHNLSRVELESQLADWRQLFPTQPLIYGGSVTSDNVAEYVGVCDGLLVGGASTKVDEFWQIVQQF